MSIIARETSPHSFPFFIPNISIKLSTSFPPLFIPFPLRSISLKFNLHCLMIKSCLLISSISYRLTSLVTLRTSFTSPSSTNLLRSLSSSFSTYFSKLLRSSSSFMSSSIAKRICLSVSWTF